MIAITLVAAIATGMLLAMRGGLLSLNRTQARLDENRRTLGIERILKLELAGAIPARRGCGGQYGPFAFRGTSTALQMVSTYSIAEGARGLPHIVEFQVAPDEGGTVKLIVNERPYVGPASTGAFCTESISLLGSPQPFVAATRLAYCRILYLQMNLDTQFRGNGWVDAWSLPDLPAAVRIDMAPSVPDPNKLPVLAVTAPLLINRTYEDFQDVDQ